MLRHRCGATLGCLSVWNTDLHSVGNETGGPWAGNGSKPPRKRTCWRFQAYNGQIWSLCRPSIFTKLARQFVSGRECPADAAQRQLSKFSVALAVDSLCVRGAGFHTPLNIPSRTARRSRRSMAVQGRCEGISTQQAKQNGAVAAVAELHAVEPKHRIISMIKEIGGGRLNTKRIRAVRAAITAAAGVPDSSITVTNVELGHCLVQSSSQSSTSYSVQDARIAAARCDCPQGLRGQLCEHAVACMLHLKYTETEVMMLHGSLYGSISADSKLGLGVVHDAATVPVSTTTALSTQGPAAAAKQTERAVDHHAECAAALADAQALLESSSANKPLLKSWEAELKLAVARMRSMQRECDSKTTEAMVQLRQNVSKRPNKGLKRQHLQCQ